MKKKYWTCSIARPVIEQVSQNAPHFAGSSGICSETKVSEQPYFLPARLLLLLILLLAGCGKAVLYDGVYTGRSEADDTGAYGEVRVTIASGKITDCSFVTWQRDGTRKDSEYGKVNGEISNQDFYDKAQLAVRAMESYAREYVKSQDLKALDAISGATIAYNQFLEAVETALEKARKLQ